MRSVKWSLAIVGTDRGYVKSKGAISRTCLCHAGIGLLFISCMQTCVVWKSCGMQLIRRKFSQFIRTNKKYVDRKPLKMEV